MITQSFTIGTIITYVITCIVCYVISVIGLAKMFEKAGTAGWKAWIPCYNSYILYKLTWNKNIFWATLIGAIVLAVVSSYTALVASVILTVIQIILELALVILGIIAAYKVSKSYGHGVGFTIGLLFVPIIFYLIIGYGASEYNRA